MFNFIRNSFVRVSQLYCDSCHIGLCFKKVIKTGEFFCSHFNIEAGKLCNIFGVLCFISGKVKMQLKHTKKICAVYGEGAVTD